MYWRLTGWSSATSTCSGRAPAARAGLCAAACVAARRLGQCSGRRKVKQLPSPGLLLRGDVAAHQPRQVARDLQAQPGAAVAARARAVALREAVEQPRQRGCVHADAGVGDVELELASLPAAAFARAHVEHHRAAVGELDGVGQQVEQDLLDARARRPGRARARPGRRRCAAPAAWPWPAAASAPRPRAAARAGPPAPRPASAARSRAATCRGCR